MARDLRVLAFQGLAHLEIDKEAAIMKRVAMVLSLVLAAGAPAAAQEDGGRGFDEARKKFPPDVTSALLEGRIAAPAGFDDRMKEELGEERLAELRKEGGIAEGRENDLAAKILVELGADPQSLAAAARPGPREGGPRGGSPRAEEKIEVEKIESSYTTAAGKTSGSFRTGQDADIVLSAIGFDQTGGPLLFNHPMGIATDGKRLLLADTYNNRILIWNALPDGNVPPDLVLGQEDFDSNNSGDGRGELNFPVQVATDGKRILVADTENHRILVWNEWPEENGEAADVILGTGDGGPGGPSKERFIWPWGLWTDGTRVVVSSTRGGAVLVWNSFPEKDGQPADLFLRGGGHLGTPRTITSDGKCLIVGDHNPKVEQNGAPPAPAHGPGAGTFFWKSFPTEDDQPYDFFVSGVEHPGEAWLRGSMASDGRLFLVGATLYLWKSFPEGADDAPDLAIAGYNFRGGDHVGTALVGERLYVCCGNRNSIVVYRRIPERADQAPDFAIGSPDIETDTLATNFIISNPIPASNGKSLFVASDLDRTLHVWRKVPDESGAHPDLVYSLDMSPMDVALHGETLVLAGHRDIRVWKKLPLEGNLPDLSFQEEIGGVRLEDIYGVALDDRYFYVGDQEAGKIHVWKGIPEKDEPPAFSLDVETVWKLSSDGEYLGVGTGFGHEAHVYPVDELGPDAKPLVIGARGRDGGPIRHETHFNGVPSVVVHRGRLFVADGGFHRVHIWNRLEDAVAGKRADVLLGEDDFDDQKPELARNGLRYPAALCFDGAYLWVAEVKFSERLLRFSPSP